MIFLDLKNQSLDKFLFYIVLLINFVLLRILTLVLRLLFFKHLLKKIHLVTRTKNKILYLEGTHYGGAGYKYRVEKWMSILGQHNYTCKGLFVFNIEEWHKKYNPENPFSFLNEYMLIRMAQVLGTVFYSHVIVRRELLIYNDYGNLFLEKFLNSIHYNIYLDFDDDIQSTKKSYPTTIKSRLLGLVNNSFFKSLNYYDHLIVGSDYLKKIAIRNSKILKHQITVIPTCVDYYELGKKEYNKTDSIIKFGWVGSDNNLFYLDQIIDELNETSQSHNIELIVISKNGYQTDKNLNLKIKNVQWDINKEVENILKIDIGLMPLNDALLDKGKCGFKLIQYMGLGIVSIASGIGVNSKIIRDKHNGFLVNENNWFDVLKEVISKKENFQNIGEAARKSIQSSYSFDSNTSL